MSVIDKKMIFTPAGIQNPYYPVRSLAMVCLNVLSSKGILGSHLNFADKNMLAVLPLAKKAFYVLKF
jgi:hypothetical protein